MNKKFTPLAAAMTAAIGLGASGAANSAAVTQLVIEDVGGPFCNNVTTCGAYTSTLDGSAGRFGFNNFMTSNFTSTSPMQFGGAANSTGSFTTGFLFSGAPFIPFTYGSGAAADITGGVLTFSSMDFGGNYAGVADFLLPPDDPVKVNWVVAGANPNEYLVNFGWQHYITTADDPTNSYVGFTANWVLEGTMTVESAAVPVPAAAYLFGSGLVGLAGVARRRRNKKEVK